ncbi:fused MFS/spermidine synthase [Thalassotalea ponticola]|uniref:fused MFS/spermidine synthase n=1 Tax=Thalassotalea ponticola TaxID=1523392 RepID=UPI0025B54727|nr:fused MFS/spermidine synthase [Thalassotalea ponticola]MDN3652489.1 fused MFS/spermidine synthase [Thalassotalea ponticola]
MQFRWHNFFIYVMAFCGGFSIMGIELLGGRILAPYFGSSVHVWGSIITVFMLALSLGYLLGGRWSLHRPQLLKYGCIFIAAGTLLLPLILFATPMLEWVFTHVEDARYGSLVASMLLFFIPSVALGMISPYSVRLLVTSEHESGHVAGILYFVSTLGSALGTLATSFYLVLWFEVNTVLIAFCCILLALGSLAIGVQTTEREDAHALLKS